MKDLTSVTAKLQERRRKLDEPERALVLLVEEVAR